jgi:class 3 adenylate cyclase
MISLAAARPYLPSLAIDWPDHGGSRWQRLEGSMIFVDVSGFTSMSERLARQGKVGAEEVTAVISDSFDHLLAVAHAQGGSLLKFGGDAQLIFFTSNGHAARAAAAAIGMRRIAESAFHHQRGR